MSDLNDLRNLVNDDGVQDDPSEPFSPFAGQEIGAPAQKTRATNQRILGMTASQRAFVSVVIFFNVLFIGLALLIATGRLSI